MNHSWSIWIPFEFVRNVDLGKVPFQVGGQVGLPCVAETGTPGPELKVQAVELAMRPYGWTEDAWKRENV